MNREITDKELRAVVVADDGNSTYAAIAESCGTSEYAVRKVMGLIP